MQEEGAWVSKGPRVQSGVLNDQVDRDVLVVEVDQVERRVERMKPAYGGAEI